MSEQCRGITKSGARCKISRNLVEGFCHLHLDQKNETKKNADKEIAARISGSAGEENDVKSGAKPDITDENERFYRKKDDTGFHRGFIISAIVFALIVLGFSFSRKRR